MREFSYVNSAKIVARMLLNYEGSCTSEMSIGSNSRHFSLRFIIVCTCWGTPGLFRKERVHSNLDELDRMNAVNAKSQSPL